MDAYAQLRAELDAWAAEGLTARLWWRDDDAVTLTPQLRRLFEVASEAAAVIALGVVPEQADGSLIEVAATGSCCIWQHGWGHHFHSSGEFGEERPVELMVSDAQRGKEAIDRLFGASE